MKKSEYMKDRDKTYLKHILEKISDIEESSRGISKEQFKGDKEKQDAILRRIEVIGEAIKNISSGTKEENPEVKWKEIAGTRDILIHAYFSVDLELVWEIVEKDLPELKDRIEKILKQKE